MPSPAVDGRATSAVPAQPDRSSASHEADRLAALHSLGVLDTEPEQAYDDLTRLAAQLCGMPLAVVSLVDVDRQWFKARLGIDVCETPRSISFSARALESTDPLVVPDTRADPRFADFPQVTRAEKPILSYAGAPLVTRDGYILGTLCVSDHRPRQLTDLQLDQLAVLARQVVSQLELRQAAHELADEVSARTAVEAALRDSRRLLDGVLEHTDVGIFAKDLQGRYLLANPAVHRLVGHADGEVLGRTDAEVFSPELAQAYRLHDAEVVATGRRQVFPETAVLTDGSTRRYLSMKFPLVDEDGRVYAVAGVSTNVTELLEERQARAESEHRWRALVEHSPVGVAVIDGTGAFAYANPSALALVGATAPEQMVGRPAVDFVPERYRRESGRYFRDLLPGGPPLLSVRRSMVRLDGTAVEIDVSAVPVTHLGQPALQVELRDVSAQAAAEAALRASELRFRTTFDNDPAGLAVLSPAGRALQVNPALCRMVRRNKQELLGLPELLSLAAADDRAAFADLARQALDGSGETLTTERQLVLLDGKALWVLITVTELPGAQEDRCLLLQVEDIADRKAAELQLARQALYDSLTDLPNRVVLLDRTTRALARLARRLDDDIVAMLFCDLDGFKAVNDAHGHAAGDALLVEVARRLAGVMRPTDTVARFGGDEFVVLCDRLGSEDEGRLIADRLEQVVSAPLNVDGAELRVTTSIGIAFGSAQDSAEALVRSADTAMYEAKRRHRRFGAPGT